MFVDGKAQTLWGNTGIGIKATRDDNAFGKVFYCKRTKNMKIYCKSSLLMCTTILSSCHMG